MILVLYVVFPRQLIGIFDPGPDDAIFVEALPMALTMLRVMALYVAVEAVMVVFSGALRGAGDTFWAMVVSVSIHWLLLAVQLIVLYGLGQTPQVTWTALVMTLLACSSLFYWRYRSGHWRHIQVVPSQAEALATDHDHDFHEPREL